MLVDCEQEKVKGGRPTSVSTGVSQESILTSPESQSLLNELRVLKESEEDNDQCKEVTNSILKRAKAAEAQVEALKHQLADMIKAGPVVAAPSIAAATPVSKSRAAVGVNPVEFKKLQKKCKDLEDQLAKGGGVDKKALDSIEKKYSKQIKDMEGSHKKAIKDLENKLAKLTNEHAGAADKIEALTSELNINKAKVKEMSSLLAEMESLKSKANQLSELKGELDALQQQYAVLGEQFKKEAALRKKYKNELEDLKGAIRVYARCRPMAQYEIEKGCQPCVKFVDDSSLKVMSSRGEKEFEFDAAFNPHVTQEAVFEDTKRLVESCLDGYNVCVFAYGQTGNPFYATVYVYELSKGSGKTHTMTGSPGNPGLTPRVVEEIFTLIRQKQHCKSNVTSYFVELYNDNLVDLYWLLENKRKGGKGNFLFNIAVR